MAYGVLCLMGSATPTSPAAAPPTTTYMIVWCEGFAGVDVVTDLDTV
jgi:hypothetical protein